MTEVHYPQCGKYPVACPNDCDENMIERQKLETHLKEECPLVLVDCPFSYAGCETQLPRKDMPEHIKESITHLTSLATTTQKLLKENQELQQKLIEREDESRKNMAEVRAALQELNTKYDSVVKENQKLQRGLNDEKRAFKKNMDSVNASLRGLCGKFNLPHSQCDFLHSDVCT